MQSQGFKTGRSVVAFGLAGIIFVILVFHAQFGFAGLIVSSAIVGIFLNLGTNSGKDIVFSVIGFEIGFGLGSFLILGSLLAFFMEPNLTSFSDTFFSFYSLYILGFTIAGALSALGTLKHPFTKRLYYGSTSFFLAVR